MCFHTHWHWDFINVAKVGRPNKRGRSVLCIDHIDGQGRGGRQKLLFAIKITTTILKQYKYTIYDLT